VGEATFLLDVGQQVTVNGRTGLVGLGPLRGVREAKTAAVEHSRHAILRGNDAHVGELIGQEPIAECGLVLVDLKERVDRVRVVPVPLANGLLAPRVVPLGRQAQDPARHRDRHPDAGTGRGHLTDEREDYFPGRLACDR
jgi:hypothetical protein